MKEYHVNLTLCRLAAIVISKRLWMNPEMKDKLGRIADGDKLTEAEIPAVIGRATDHFIIPTAAKEELKFAVGSTALRILQFLSTLQEPPEYSCATEDTMLSSKMSSCVDYVCWTTAGCIDEAQTIRSLYFAGKFREKFRTWAWLCIHCLEDCIDDLWSKLGKTGRYKMWWVGEQPVSGDFTVDVLVSYWSVHGTNNVRDIMYVFLRSPDHFYDDAYSLEENMFISLIVCKAYPAIEYFWGLLNEHQRFRTISKIGENIMSDDPWVQMYKSLFFSGRGRLDVNFILFFLQQFSRYGLGHVRNEMIGSGFVLKELLDWPYEITFMKTLRESWIHHDSINYKPIILRFFGKLDWCRKNGFSDPEVKYRKIFYTIWRMIPHKLKNSINYTTGLIQFLWCSKHIDIVNHILTDEELKDRRKELLAGLVDIDDNELIARVLVYKEEQMWFSRLIAYALEEKAEDVVVDI